MIYNKGRIFHSEAAMGIFAQPFGMFLGELGSTQPSPGGGAAAAMSGAMAAALVSKVARFSINQPHGEYSGDDMAAFARLSDDQAQALTRLADEDARAYGAVAALKSLPKSTEAEKVARKAASAAAWYDASDVAVQIAEHAMETLALAAALCRTGNLHLLSDLLTAMHLARAAIAGTAENARENAARVKDVAQRVGLLERLERALNGMSTHSQAIAEIVELRRRQAAATNA
jgi:methenyltetrahydrofolate cyclohydrolase